MRGIVTKRRYEVAILSYSFVLDFLYDEASTHSILPPSKLTVTALDIFYASIPNPMPDNMLKVVLKSLSSSAPPLLPSKNVIRLVVMRHLWGQWIISKADRQV
jgi:hypothetical protein